MNINEYRKLGKKGNKFNAKKTLYNGVLFDSKKEANRAYEIDMFIQGGLISKVEYQPRFDIVVNDKKIGFYKADFKVFYPDGKIEIEDVKGMKTPVYKIKKKLVEALYYIKILEI